MHKLIYTYIYTLYVCIWLCQILVVTRGIFSCDLWDLVPWPEIEPRPSALGTWSPSHWTTREIPHIGLFCSCLEHVWIPKASQITCIKWFIIFLLKLNKNLLNHKSSHLIRNMLILTPSSFLLGMGKGPVWSGFCQPSWLLLFPHSLSPATPKLPNWPCSKASGLLHPVFLHLKLSLKLILVPCQRLI